MANKHDVKKELQRRQIAKAKSIGPEVVRSLAFDKQIAVLDDTSTRKAIFCPRRAAKTMTDALALVETCLRFPGCNTAFVGLTRGSAKGTVWKDGICYLNDKLGLGLDPHLAEQKFTFPNGSEILVTGIDADANDSKKQLGRKLKRVCLDEASMFSVDIRTFIEGIIEPALVDQMGDIIMSGTASDICSGLFFDVTQGTEPGWSVHRWQATDNPHVRENWLARLEEIKQTRPLFLETALFRQHWLNEWVVNQDAQCYRFDPIRNKSDSLPLLKVGGWTHILGVDLGHSPDPSAFVVCAFHEHCSTMFVKKAHSVLRMDFTAVSEEIKRLMTEYSIDQVVIDGSNKQGVAEMQNRHGLSLEAADKREKSDFISLMSDDLIQGKVVILPGCEALAEEWTKLVWVSKDGKIVYPRKENPNCSNHLTDAALYAWRKCTPFLAEDAPIFRTPQQAMTAKGGWIAHSSKLMEENLQRQIDKEENDEMQLFNEEVMFSDEDPLRVALNHRRKG